MLGGQAFCGADMKPVVREIVAKTILNRSTLGGYSLNCYIGCQHACVYCYARYMQRFHPHKEAWGDFVDVKVNAVEALYKQLRRAEPGDVFVSSACDAYQPLERQYRLTRRCAEVLMEYGFQVNVLTKSTLVLEDLDMYVRGRTARIGVTVTTPSDEIARIWEPGAAPPSKRFAVLARAKEAGLATSVMFGPLLPGLSDDAGTIGILFQKAADLDVDVIWTDCMNPRPKVWESVRKVLTQRYPQLASRYRGMLFSKGAREEYVAELGRRIRRAAENSGVGKRLAGCP